MIVSDDCRVINKLEASLTNNARVVIYDYHLFIVQTTGNGQFARILHLTNRCKSQLGLSNAQIKKICLQVYKISVGTIIFTAGFLGQVFFK
jgi:hypothetical protein